MRSMLVAIFLVISILAVYAAGEPTKIEVGSTIKTVTVFSDRAMVKRDFRQAFEPGIYKVEVQHLPAGLLDESIRVSGEGTAKAKILGVEIKPVYLEQAARQNQREAETKLYKLNQQTLVLDEKIAVLNQQKEFVKSIGTKTAESINQDLPIARPSVAEWSQMVKFIGSNLDSINQAIRQIDEAKISLEAQKTVARNELQSMISKNSRQEKSALIDVSIENGGSLNMEVTYVIMGASWSPLYDIRVNSETKETEVTYFGNISQRTGEDWQDAKLTLSTAITSTGGALPELTAKRLDIRKPIPVPPNSTLMFRSGRAYEQAYLVDSMQIQDQLGGYGAISLSPERTQIIKAQAETSLVSNAGISTTFELIQKVSASSGDKPVKVVINTLKLKGDLDHIAVPKLSENVYLKAKVKNSSELPLLSGRANIFYDGDFVSATAIPTCVANESFELFLGVDQGMKIKRELVEKFTDETGLTNSKERVTYEYKITADNYRKTEETITILDQYPVSANDNIEVNLKSATPEPNLIVGDKESGMLRWIFSLKPSAKQEMRFKYEVKYPKGEIIEGLN